MFILFTHRNVAFFSIVVDLLLQKIKKEIVMRYKAVKNNKNYQATKQKFQYLHDKLSHIKKLVSDFDNLHLKNSNACKMEPVS